MLVFLDVYTRLSMFPKFLSICLIVSLYFKYPKYLIRN